MKIVLFGLIILVTANISFAQTTIWKDDPMHSKLAFIVTHKGLSSISGLFQKFEVAITTSKLNFADAVFTLSVDAASVNTEVKKRDDDLRSANFFDVVKYPVITFKSTSIRNTTGMKDRFKVTGDITMHGVTRSVTMDLWFRGIIEDTMSKKTKAGFQLTCVINRADFKVGDPDPFDISTDIIINADGEFFKD